MKPNVEMVIENLIESALGPKAAQRERYMLRETLRGLVRLAKSEQLNEIKLSVKKLTGAITSNAIDRKEKVDALLQSRNADHRNQQKQRRLNRHTPCEAKLIPPTDRQANQVK